MDYKVIIGLGTNTAIDSMIIQWPDLSYSRYLHPGLDKVYVLKEAEENKYNLPPAEIKVSKTIFTKRNSDFEKHTEDDYVDFYYERNAPEMLSREGPKATTGDVNGDGLEDVFIGGTHGHTGQLYMQQPDGKFVKKD